MVKHFLTEGVMGCLYKRYLKYFAYRLFHLLCRNVFNLEAVLDVARSMGAVVRSRPIRRHGKAES